MATTPTIQPPEDYTPLTADQKSQWNGFASYLGKQNVGPALDSNPDLGHAYMQQYSQKTPDFSITPDQIPHIQYEHQAMRTGDNPLAALGNDSYYARKTSPVNGQINSVTASSYYPTFATRNASGKTVTDYGTDSDKFLAENPTAITAPGGGPASKKTTAPATGGGGGKSAPPPPAAITPANPPAPAGPVDNQWKQQFLKTHTDATGTLVRPSLEGNFKPGRENDKSNAPTDVPKPEQQDTGPYKDLSDAYYKAYGNYQTSLSAHDTVDYSASPTVKVQGGKDPGISVPVQMIKDVATSAKKNGYDPYMALAQLSQESSFGNETSKSAGNVHTKGAIVQSTNLDEPYRPQSVEQWMNNHGAPGIKAYADKLEGQKYVVDDQQKLNTYLQAHPEVVKQYQDHLAARSAIPATYDTYDSMIKRDKTGLRNYNVDPAYARNIKKYADQLRSDPSVKPIVDTL